MGKYLPIIVTADCGSLTRAGKLLGYAQPNMCSIVTRFEKELGIKIFHRTRNGVILTETGEKLVTIMRQIDAMEDRLHEVAVRIRTEQFRVGVFQSVATQWMPQIMAAFCKKYPDTVFQLDYPGSDLDCESAVREHRVDCAFFRGDNFPEGMEHIPLLTDPFYLLVPADSPLAEAPSVSLSEVAGHYPYIHTNERFDREEDFAELRQRLRARDTISVSSPEDSAVISLVSQGLGVSILPELSLCGITAAHAVRAIPLENGPVRTVSLLYSRDPEHPALTSFFLTLLRNRVEEWAAARTLPINSI